MARQNIQFRGLRHSPSDITGQDGDLLECVNLIHENGEMKPIEMPEKIRIGGKDEIGYFITLMAIHNLTSGKKYVFGRSIGNAISKIIIKDEDNTVIFTTINMFGELQWVETIGNTLIIGTSKSIYYAVFKNGAYKWLGDKLPQPVFRVDFSRNNTAYEGHYINEDDPQTYTLTPDGNTAEGGGITLHLDNLHGNLASQAFDATLSKTTNENKKIFRDGIRARHAQVMSVANNANMFVYPFMIRYAVRMYDGNYAMHSAPILMIPSSLVCPLLSYMTLRESESEEGLVAYGHDGDEYYQIADEAMQFRAMGLNYAFYGWKGADGTDISDVSDWSDIIRGVDLFLSSQIYSFDERAWDNLNNVPTTFKTFPEYIHSGWDVDGFYGHCYTNNQRLKWWDIYTYNNSLQFGWSDRLTKIHLDDGTHEYLTGFHCRYRIDLPSLSSRQMMERIKETNLFYRVKQYDLEELSNPTGWLSFENEVEQGTLERLETLPILRDDYVSRCRMTGKVSYNYNQRLVLGNIYLQAPKWYSNVNNYYSNIFSLNICFEIEKPEKTIYIRYDHPITNGNGLGIYDFGHFIYYPDMDCKRMVVEIKNDKGVVVATKTIPMHEHTGLNGAFALMPNLQSLYESYSSFKDGTLQDQSDDRYYNLPNTIAMSSVANPFHFPATNFKDIGRTKVVGIAANTLDVSSGQWGQYPLYVFCSDGIIAIIIDGEGKFGGIQAVSSDVLREPRGLSQPTLVQTGQALMFLTQRGVMAIAGTQINCLSEAMNGRHFNPMRELADVDYHVGAFANLIGRTSDDTDFRDFAASGFLAFDYAHNRVLLLRPDRDYQYVYSMNTGMWSKEIVYTNLDSFQIEVVPGNGLPAQRSGGVPLLQVKPMLAAVNNYTEMFLQDADGWLYKTMEVQGQNSVKQLYQYGYIVSRPIRFGTDEYKTVVNALHRFNHYAKKSFVKLAMYGSRDGVKYGRINSLRGMSYQYFIFVIYTYLKPNERYSYLTVDFETRLTNKLR